MSVLIMLLGIAHAAGDNATRNLVLPAEVMFEAERSSQEWLDAGELQEAWRDAVANCKEQQADSWRRGTTPIPAPAWCADMKEAPDVILDRYGRHKTMRRSSMHVVRDRADTATHAELAVQLQADADGNAPKIASAQWCVLPFSERDREPPEELSLERCAEEGGTRLEGAQVAVRLSPETVGVAWWIDLEVEGEEGRTTVRAARMLDGSILTGTGPEGRGAMTAGLSAASVPTDYLAGAAGVDQGAILIGLTDYLIERADTELRAWALDSQVRELCARSSAPGKPPGPGDLLEQTCEAVQREGVRLLFSGASVLQVTARDDMTALARNLGEAGVIYGNGQPSGVDGLGLARHDASAALAALGRALELSLNGASPERAFAGFATDPRWTGAITDESGKPPARLGTDYPLTTSTWLAAAALATLPRSTSGSLFPRADDDWLALSPFLAAALEHNLKRTGMWEPVRQLLHLPKDALALSMSVQDVLASWDSQGIADRAREIERLQERVARATDPDELAALRVSAIKATGELAASVLSSALASASAVQASGGAGSTPEQQASLRALIDLARATGSGTYGKAIIDGLALAEAWFGSGGSDWSIDPSLRSALAFIASLAQADSPQAARDTIDAWAAPVGSYLRKHDGDGFYAGVNAYFGLSGGAEWLVNVDDERRFSAPAGQVAPAVMVGVDFGHRFPRDGYLGGFASLLDLGALATARVEGKGESDTEVEYASKLSFRQVFSPGLYVVTSPWRAPFALGVGASVAPSLREITSEGEVLEDEIPILRVSGLIALDLPLNP